MATAKEKMNEIAGKIAAHPEQVKSINAIYKFALSGEGGGTWIVNLADSPGVTEGDGDAQCTIKMNATDFVDMFEGRANGQQLFFAGKLRIEGDMGLAMKLQKLTEVLR